MQANDVRALPCQQNDNRSTTLNTSDLNLHVNLWRIEAYERRGSVHISIMLEQRYLIRFSSSGAPSLIPFFLLWLLDLLYSLVSRGMKHLLEWHQSMNINVVITSNCSIGASSEYLIMPQNEEMKASDLVRNHRITRRSLNKIASSFCSFGIKVSINSEDFWFGNRSLSEEEMLRHHQAHIILPFSWEVPSGWWARKKNFFTRNVWRDVACP